MKTDREMLQDLEREAKTWGLAYRLARTQEQKDSICDLIHSYLNVAVDVGGVSFGEKFLHIVRKEAGIE